MDDVREARRVALSIARLGGQATSRAAALLRLLDRIEAAMTWAGVPVEERPVGWEVAEAVDKDSWEQVCLRDGVRSHD